MYLLFTMLFTMLFIADTNGREAKKKTLAVQGFLVEVAGFEPAAFWSWHNLHTHYIAANQCNQQKKINRKLLTLADDYAIM